MRGSFNECIFTQLQSAKLHKKPVKYERFNKAWL